MSSLESDSDNEDYIPSEWDTVQLIDIQLNNPTLNEFLENEKNKTYFIELNKFIETEKKKIRKVFDIFPPPSLVYNCLNLCDYDNIKVVIIGQDPYHGKGQGMGLAFSVNKGIAIPPSLRNIYKELKDELDIAIPNHGDLTSWNEQGVLLLNTALTVRERKAGSHSKYWIKFTDNLITHLSNKGGIVFILWGNHAKNKSQLIDIKNNNHVLTATHPSPMASNKGGFFGCNNFKDCNKLLNEMGKTEINWNSINIYE